MLTSKTYGLLLVVTLGAPTRPALALIQAPDWDEPSAPVMAAEVRPPTPEAALEEDGAAAQNKEQEPRARAEEQVAIAKAMRQEAQAKAAALAKAAEQEARAKVEAEAGEGKAAEKLARVRAEAKEAEENRGFGERVNVRIDLRLRAQRGSNPAVEKTLSLVTLGDNSRTSIRTNSNVPVPVPKSEAVNYTELPLNVDVRASVGGRRVLLQLTLDYRFASVSAEGEGRASGTAFSRVVNDIRTVLDDGKPLVISDQVDAASDHRVTAEVKATILR